MSADDLRVRHFERLNGYRLSQEFQAFAQEVGRDVPPGDLPSLLGNKWEITEEIYDEFLNMLPPLGWRGNTFYMSEFAFGNITSKFTKEGDRFYCEHARYPGVAP